MISEEIKTLVNQVQKDARQIRMKADFEAGIENDYAYIKGLKNCIEAMEEAASHRKKEQATKRFDKMSDDWKADEIMELAYMEVKLNEMREKMLLQQKVLADKVQHFTDVFLPMYEKRLAEVKENWDEQWKEIERVIWDFTAKKSGEELEQREVVRLEKLVFYRDQYFQLPKHERADIEIKSNYYFIFTNLLPQK